MKSSRKMLKITAMAGISALALAGLSACGGGASETKTPEAKSPASEKPVTIKYLHRLPDGDGMTKVADVVAEWNKEHPNIQVEATKFDGKPQELIKKLETDVKAGTAPCLAQVGYADLAEVYVKQLVEDVSGEIGKYKDKFAEAPLNSMSVDGKYFGLPQDTGPLVYYYNKAAFEELGLKVPTTSDELIEEAKKAAAKGKYIVDYQTDEAGNMMPALSAAAGDQWFKVEGDSWKVDTSGTGSAKVADFWQKLLDAKATATVQRWSEETWKSALNDNIIGTIGAAWEAPLLAGDMAGTPNEGKWAVAQLPSFGDKAATGPDGGSGVAVIKGCEAPAQAMEFNAWFNTQIEALVSQGLVVAAKGKMTTPEKVSKFYGGQDVAAELTKANETMNPFTYIPSWSSVQQNAEQAQKAVDGGKVADLFKWNADTAKEALKNLNLKVS
ncbi:ABC transporter substrate-binding protein [Mobiluncus mulieris]|uniref:Extracellular solute-binding protein n=1 Tax=Mobiluncus mulieris TaxID=2052 RepID=A0ABD4TZL4_9ACTO|nr:extracellular solute-binding protein [Mobiluncus mulieris]MCU9969835.1 extracellular solute-binding protein [Mobiluncus mulieris]MCU9974283.1 extracellular solute-binding protein [Mobiluncus mulieris]MCV0010337.1 extracellular solute-binding protein [Mobiluncus mulieris]NMW76033.1 extracellular solute-binding protein [Mobiluncus mulieris]NMX02164.1 extracellular solute-binding protein [Mobiluncus mulieris]